MVGEGISELMQAGKWDEAIRACEACLQVQPCLGRVHALMGECYYQQHDYIRAEPCFMRACTLDPQLSDAATRQAQCLERLHRYRDAMDVVKYWMAIKPNDHTLQGLFEFLKTQDESEEHDGWERSRHIGVTIINAGFGRTEPPAVGHEEDEENVVARRSDRWSKFPGLHHGPELG